jgi:hypothetical protein
MEIKMKRFSQALALSVLLCSSFSTQAATLDQFGARATTSVTSCYQWSPCSYNLSGNAEGGVGEISTSTSAISSYHGHTQANAALSGGLSSPILKADAFANPIGTGGPQFTNPNGTMGTAFAVQGYTYTGAGETLTLDIGLDGVINDRQYDANNTKVTMEVVLFDASQNFVFESNRDVLSSLGAVPLTQSGGGVASALLTLDHTNPTTDNASISIDVVNGDEIYLWALLSAEAKSGVNATSADAFNTGTMGFQGTPNLVAASSPVPVPAAVWLFGSGLLGLLGVVRRRKT